MTWAKLKTDEAINRFPICATWYTVIAELLGYTPNQSKSIGLARATFFARAKAGGFGRKKKSEVKIPSVGNKPTLEKEIKQFAGLDIYLSDNGLAVFGGVEQTPLMYKKSVEDKIEKVLSGSYSRLFNAMKMYAADYTMLELNSPFAYNLYERIRDEYRTKKFYGINN